MPERPILLVCNKHDDTMSFVDLASFEVLETIPTGPNPHEIVVTPDNRWAYLSNYAPPGNTISLIDLVAAKHVRQISTGEYSRIHGAALAPDGRWAYFTAGQTGYVLEVDTVTNEVTRAIATYGKVSHMVAVSRDGNFLYIANIATENVSVLDRATGALVSLVPCGPGVEGLGITPDNTELWALNQEAGTVAIISLPSHEVKQTFPCPGMPVRVAFALGGQLALVPSWTEHGELAAIETVTRREVGRVAVGSQAIGIVLSPEGDRAFVGCEHTDGVHVVDIQELAVVERFFTGNGSDAMAIWYPPRWGLARLS